MRETEDLSTSARMRAELLRYQACLFDPETKLPTLPVVLDRVRKLLDASKIVRVFVVRIEHEQWLERTVGWESYDRLLRDLARHLQMIVDSEGAPGTVLCQHTVRSDTFLVFSPDRAEAMRIERQLAQEMPLPGGDGGGAPSVDLRFGQGVIKPCPTQRVERCIHSGAIAAWNDLQKQAEVLDEDRRRELHRILRDRSVTTLFQPIFSLPGRDVVGYEALSRGPRGTYLEPAENLFGFAERAGLLGDVEALCLETALANAHRLRRVATVFLNLSIRGLEFLESEQPGLVRIVHDAGWSPSDVVLEITERTCAESPNTLPGMIARLRGQGFRIAIDDMGTGYSSLHMLAELDPDFIKLDHLLVRDLDQQPIKRNLVSAIIGFAFSSRTKVIAEGVERPGEVAVLQELGVAMAQGFHFGYPEAV